MFLNASSLGCHFGVHKAIHSVGEAVPAQVTVPISKMSKLALREVKCFAQVTCQISEGRVELRSLKASHHLLPLPSLCERNS